MGAPQREEGWDKLYGEFKTLAVKELANTGDEVVHHAEQILPKFVMAGTFAGIASLGVFAVLVGTIWGLGRLLDDRYWLSSILIGGTVAGVGGAASLNALKHRPNASPDR